ncbi:MAG: PAS domain-containing protein [Magnetococcales bacterium]|nr:PAS domain-containing protein [Magnetococcales bacterium]
MSISFRGRLFLATILLLIVTDLAIGLHLERGLRTWIQDNAEEELYRNAKAARELLILAGEPYTLERMDPLADRFAYAVGQRITVIDPKGRVLGDSKLDGPPLHQLENHGGRPEVKAALLNKRGVARRFSQTLGASMLYVATPFPHPDGLGVVRVQMSLEAVDQIIHRIRLFLLVAASWGLVVLVVISGVATHLLTRTLRKLARRVNRSIGGVLSEEKDEISNLSGSFDRITQNLGDTLTSLSLERNRFETVLEGMVEAVFALDGGGRIILVNQAVKELIDEPEVLIGQRLTEVIGGPEIEALVEIAIQGGQATKQFDLVSSPQQRRLLARISALKSGGCVAVFHDISDIHRLEEMRREFVANVSHELRTPVSVILANAETLIEEFGEEGAEHPMVEALHRHATRLSDTISELLDLSRLDAGAYVTEVQMIHLESVFSHHLETVLFTSERTKPIEIEIPLGLQMVGDAHALARILSNLIGNAVKYSPLDGRIVLRAFRVGEEIQIEVEDEGPGIDPQYQDLIFKRFHRAANGHSVSVGGTGLGLAIVQSYLAVMNGRITYRSAHPRGSIFQITLPTIPLA